MPKNQTGLLSHITHINKLNWIKNLSALFKTVKLVGETSLYSLNVHLSSIFWFYLFSSISLEEEK